MFNEEQIDLIEKFCKVLNGEERIIFEVNKDLLTIKSFNYNYISTLKLINGDFIVFNNINEFKEKDLADGLVRTRFEFMKFLNPNNF